jgi:hypothetical protein
VAVDGDGLGRQLAHKAFLAQVSLAAAALVVTRRTTNKTALGVPVGGLACAHQRKLCQSEAGRDPTAREMSSANGPLLHSPPVMFEHHAHVSAPVSLDFFGPSRKSCRAPRSSHRGDAVRWDSDVGRAEREQFKGWAERTTEFLDRGVTMAPWPATSGSATHASMMRIIADRPSGWVSKSTAGCHGVRRK